MMNKSLEKQIKIYTGVVSALLAADKASGQIVYVDVNPDDTLNSFHQHFLYDLDSDSITDFEFYQYVKFFAGPGSSAHVDVVEFMFGKNNNEILDKGNHGCGYFDYMSDAYDKVHLYPIPYPSQVANFNQTVKFESWDLNITSTSGYIPGCFFAVSPLGIDKFVGVKFFINGQNHYGWIRIGFRYQEIIIKDFAYNSIPDAALLAGDTTNATLILHELNSGFQILQQHNNIHISSTKSLAIAVISVFDLLGKEILKQSFSGTQTEISIDKKGIYFVEVSSGEKVYRKKVFVY